MRMVFFDFTVGCIGLEAYDTKIFLYFTDYFRAYGIEPLLICSGKSHNATLALLRKRKFSELGVLCLNIPRGNFFEILYNVLIRNRITKGRFFKTVFQDNKRVLLDSSKQYAQYLIKHRDLFARFDNPPFAFEALNSPKANLSFLKNEDELACAELKRMGVNGEYVCIHARDDLYYEQEAYKNIQRANRETPRNMDFHDFLPACRYLQQKEVYSLRMGAVQKPVKKDVLSSYIIDYAGEYRSDFMDIWLIAHCLFFLGSSSGLFAVPYLFNKPVALANVVPLLAGVPSGAKDIYLPVKIWDRNRKRLLTFKEISRDDIGLEGWELPERYAQEGLENIRNTPDEIAALAQEMYEVSTNQYHYTPEDNYLQERFKSVFKEHHGSYQTPSRVGREFLRQNKELFL